MPNETKNLKPLFDNVLLKVAGTEKKVVKGVFIPDTGKKDDNRQAEVLAVGPGKIVDGKWTTMSVKVGDKVLFSGHNDGLKITEGEDLYIVCGQEFIKGKYEVKQEVV